LIRTLYRHPKSTLFPYTTLFRSLAGALSCLAQPQAHLTGVIVDPSSGSVPDATVSVVNEDLGFRRVTQSQADGRYSVSSLQPGVDRKSTRLNSSHQIRSYPVFGL